MIKLLFSCILLIIPLLCFSQTNTPEVIVSTGGQFANTHAQISWTLGDFQTTTYTNTDQNLILTQGFLQSKFDIADVINIEESNDIKIKVFPNPVKNILNIQIQSKENQDIRWELITQSGKIIETSHSYNQNNDCQINFSSFENGIYFIRTYTKDGSYLKVFKVVYLN